MTQNEANDAFPCIREWERGRRYSSYSELVCSIGNLRCSLIDSNVTFHCHYLLKHSSTLLLFFFLVYIYIFHNTLIHV